MIMMLLNWVIRSCDTFIIHTETECIQFTQSFVINFCVLDAGIAYSYHWLFTLLKLIECANDKNVDAPKKKNESTTTTKLPFNQFYMILTTTKPNANFVWTSFLKWIAFLLFLWLRKSNKHFRKRWPQKKVCVLAHLDRRNA